MPSAYWLNAAITRLAFVHCLSVTHVQMLFSIQIVCISDPKVVVLCLIVAVMLLRSASRHGFGNACRLAKGKDVQHICECVHKAAQQLQGPELDALKAWAWQFGMHVTLFMVQVGGCLSSVAAAEACIKWFSEHMMPLLLAHISLLYMVQVCMLLVGGCCYFCTSVQACVSSCAHIAMLWSI